MCVSQLQHVTRVSACAASRLVHQPQPLAPPVHPRPRFVLPIRYTALDEAMRIGADLVVSFLEPLYAPDKVCRGGGKQLLFVRSLNAPAPTSGSQALSPGPRSVA